MVKLFRAIAIIIAMIFTVGCAFPLQGSPSIARYSEKKSIGPPAKKNSQQKPSKERRPTKAAKTVIIVVVVAGTLFLVNKSLDD